MKASSIAGESYATTFISEPGLETPPELDEYELVSSTSESSSPYTISEYDADHDSTFGDCPPSLLTSVKSFVTQYPYANGRRYHAFRAGSYLMPNDDREQDRMDMSHHVWRVMMHGAPCSEKVLRGLGLFEDGSFIDVERTSNSERILDVGTGTGLWAIDFADEYTDSGVQVVGNDLSPIQPRWVPPNCSFIVDDFEQPWTYHPSEAFSFIHCRALAGSVKSWPAFLSNAISHLTPDGYIEIKQCEIEIYSDSDPALSQHPSLRNGQQLLYQASEKAGKTVRITDVMEDWLRDAGFVDVGHEVLHVPIGTWAADEALKQVGVLHREVVVDAVEAYVLALFTKVLGWGEEDTRLFVSKVQDDLKDRKGRLYSRFHVFNGRRPSN